MARYASDFVVSPDGLVMSSPCQFLRCLVFVLYEEVGILDSLSQVHRTDLVIRVNVLGVVNHTIGLFSIDLFVKSSGSYAKMFLQACSPFPERVSVSSASRRWVIIFPLTMTVFHLWM